MRFLVTLCLLISLSAKSQTTTEIYNYVTLGYVTGLKQGLDFKQGYKYKEIIKGTVFTGTLGLNKYQFIYRTVFKENEPKNTLAFMILLMKDGFIDKVFCLPAYGSDPALWTKYLNDINVKLFTDQKDQLMSNITSLFTLSVKTLEQKK